jgi:hypothetical protein
MPVGVDGMAGWFGLGQLPEDSPPAGIRRPFGADASIERAARPALCLGAGGAGGDTGCIRG